MTERNREQNRDSEYYTGEHILVCLSSSPSNAKVIRAAARMANAFRARFTAVHVEMPGGEGMAEEDALRLRMNQRLAEQLVPRLEVYLIPDNYTQQYHRKKHLERLIAAKEQNYLRDTLLMAAILAASTILAYLFRLLGIDEANIVTIYILGVLLIALITENQIYNLLASVLSVACFNIFFTYPYHSLRVYMATLRKKIEPDRENPRYIQTRVGIGYKMNRL